MREKNTFDIQKKIILFLFLGFLFCGLMLSSIHCNGICVDNTKFCAIIKDFAPLNVQPALEDCPTSLIICDGEQIVLFWKAEAALTSTVHLTGPGGESYEYSIIEGQATVTPRTSGFWWIKFTGKDCTFNKSIWVRVIKGEEIHTIMANGNSDIGFFCDINPKSVSKKLIVKKIRSVKCAGISEYWENWSCKKTDWNNSSSTSFNITKVDGSANCTSLAGHWRFDPMALSQGGNFTYQTKTVCFDTIITCGPCNGTSSDIYPTSTPTPWR
jgi:hypothetical protein